jgi:hypothetical protein
VFTKLGIHDYSFSSTAEVVVAALLAIAIAVSTFA